MTKKTNIKTADSLATETYLVIVFKVAEHSFLMPMRYSLLFLNQWQVGGQNWQAASSTKCDYFLIGFIGLSTIAMAT